MNLEMRREALNSVIQELEAERSALDACQDAELLEQRVKAVQSKWASLVSDAVCGVRR